MASVFMKQVELDWVAKNNEHLSFRVEGNHSQGESLQTPDYVLGEYSKPSVGFWHGHSVDHPERALKIKLPPSRF